MGCSMVNISLMNPKVGQQCTSPDARQRNLISQWSGSNSSVRKILLLKSVTPIYEEQTATKRLP